MRRLARALVSRLLPPAHRDVEILAAELAEARAERRLARIDAARGELHRAVAARLERAATARDRALEARQAAAAADEYQREFLLGTSHEIRTPLNAIQGFSRVLLDGIDGSLAPEERLDVESIHEAGEHLLELLRDFLEVVADRANPVSLEVAPFSGSELALEVGRLAKGLSRRSSVRFVVVRAARDVTFHADRGRIRQVLVNLVSNALKFTTEGEVALEVRAGPGGLGTFLVRDTGPGMEHPELGPGREFEQASDEARRARGSGLGLSIADRIVRLSGGEMHIESRVGEGTAVAVSLPCSAEEPP